MHKYNLLNPYVWYVCNLKRTDLLVLDIQLGTLFPGKDYFFRSQHFLIAEASSPFRDLGTKWLLHLWKKEYGISLNGERG